MQKNIHAWTAPGAVYPEYISLNEKDGQAVLTVRGLKLGKDDKSYAPGPTVSVPLPDHVLWELRAAIGQWTARKTTDA